MNINTKIARYNVLPNELIGKTIKEVTYYEIDYGAPCFEFEDHHSVDFGLQLITNTGTTYYIIWGAQYIQYDLKFEKGSITKEMHKEATIKCYNVSQLKHWKKRIGVPIQNIKSYWSYITTTKKGEKTYYPQDLEISFKNGLNVIISALEIKENEEVSSMANHISVFFNTETAIKYGAKNSELISG